MMNDKAESHLGEGHPVMDDDMRSLMTTLGGGTAMPSGDGCRTVVVVGSVNADYTVVADRLPGPGETVNGGPLTILPGGKGANQAASAGRLGARVRFLGAVGDDDNASFLLERLHAAGVDVAAVRHVPGPSGTTVITVDSHGENTIVYSAASNATVDVDYVHAHAGDIAAAAAVGLCLETPMPAVIAAAHIAHDQGVTVLFNDSPFHANLPRELVEAVDVLLINEHEAAQLLDMPSLAAIGAERDACAPTDWDVVANRLHDRGFTRAIITLGAHGYVIVDGEDWVREPAVPVKAKDTTGCGDAFMGTVLAGLASGNDLRHAAKMAAYASAFAATRFGAQASYGTLDDIIGWFTRL